MPALSDYLQGAVLNWLKGTAMPSAPAKLYLGLLNTSPTDAGTTTGEVTTTIRTAGRVEVAMGAITSSPTAPDSMANSADVSFGAAAGSATVTHGAVFDAASGGNMLWYAPLSGGSASIAAGSTVTVAAGTMTLSLG